ncbi:ribosome maturation factor RimP [Bhargavaea beijingensis]|uniref:Ribosome maturation factor RimP n=1 Tax=Bhargavaea beijingensis TaxID=426756 RepID=A0A1G7CDC4_9BACL|nr:ribosome maturation factor RimP [Bhargavaea beijingensis]MCW1926940.1 ribosome maturation factor RimP [Bhargavaea beijingensis]RSK36818.1 ribosome maturation factor RimP [Bhargavaea beijingensis]SDE37291.1 ribosome maturation factor RimP [Bhargavaea beijingensis]
MSKVTQEVETLVAPILEEQDLELVDIEFVKEGRDWFLRVFIDTPGGGIDIEQCAAVSEQLSIKLDEADPIPQNYFLEVSSPGAERPLKKEQDMERAVGQYVHIRTYEQIDGRKEFEGYLLAYGGEGAEIEMKVKTRKVIVLIPKDKIAFARLAIDFSA